MYLCFLDVHLRALFTNPQLVRDLYGVDADGVLQVVALLAAALTFQEFLGLPGCRIVRLSAEKVSDFELMWDRVRVGLRPVDSRCRAMATPTGAKARPVVDRVLVLSLDITSPFAALVTA